MNPKQFPTYTMHVRSVVMTILKALNVITEEQPKPTKKR